MCDHCARHKEVEAYRQYHADMVDLGFGLVSDQRPSKKKPTRWQKFSNPPVDPDAGDDMDLTALERARRDQKLLGGIPD